MMDIELHAERAATLAAMQAGGENTLADALPRIGGEMKLILN